MILVIDNYDSFTYNLVQYLGELGADPQVYRNDQIDCGQIEELNPDGLLISPGPGRPEAAGVSMDAIKHFAGKLPILGICLGHQAIGQVYGARIVPAPELVHGKTSFIFHRGDPLLEGLPNPFAATRYHSLVVDRSSVREPLEVTAETEDGLVMALKHRHQPIFGLQFHPESILTQQGKQCLSRFLEICQSGLKPMQLQKEELR